MSNNLGSQAQCDTLTANTQVKSPSFSQRFRVSGSATVPMSFTTLNNQEGINKYVWYRNLISGVNITATYAVRGVPADFVATHSIISSITAVPSGSFSTNPMRSFLSPLMMMPQRRWLQLQRLQRFCLTMGKMICGAITMMTMMMMLFLRKWLGRCPGQTAHSTLDP